MSHIVSVTIQGRIYQVERRNGGAVVNGHQIEWERLTFESNGGALLVANGMRLNAVIDQDGSDRIVCTDGREFRFDVETERERLLRSLVASSGSSHSRSEVHASMPGLVVKISVQVGHGVKRGEPLLILEAMKMENEIRAPRDGVVSEITAIQGRPVEKGDLLVTLES